MKKNHAFVEMIKNNIGILAGLLILCIALSLLTDKFATTTNFFNIVKQITINLYLACGMTFVILLGGIDLSVGSVIAVAGCVSAGMATWNSIPVQLFMIIIIIALCSFILNRTRLGKHIYAVGGNKTAAEYSGIDTKKVIFFVFAFSGLLASIAGILTCGRTFSATIQMGQSAEMDAIAAVVLGGTSMSGGKGRISGTVIGVLIIGVLNNGMNLLGIDSSWQYIVQGIVILIAVYIDFIRSGGSLGFLKKIRKKEA